MKHATSRMLFAYWDSLRGERAAPERSDISPGDMRHILADTFILAVDDDRIARFRLAGTRIGALFGRDLKGSTFARLWGSSEPEESARLVDIAVSETVGVLVGLVGANENGSELAMEMLILPLRHRGRTDLRLLGAASPAVLPSWAGLVPLAHLATRSMRIIEPSREIGAPADTPTSPGRRQLLVVHDGGLA